MTAEQIAKTLSQKGFVTSLNDCVVTVGLNRPIDIMEVQAALDFEIEQEHIWKSGKNVQIIGLDS